MRAFFVLVCAQFVFACAGDVVHACVCVCVCVCWCCFRWRVFLCACADLYVGAVGEPGGVPTERVEQAFWWPVTQRTSLLMCVCVRVSGRIAVKGQAKLRATLRVSVRLVVLVTVRIRVRLYAFGLH